jgi:hypothetical protein
MLILTLALSLFNFVMAETIDQKLEGYIQEFKLRPLNHGQGYNPQLFEENYFLIKIYQEIKT